jgi:DNA-binding transcriptional LysR family regulator
LLTIGAITSAMLEIVPPFLDRFRMLHPGLTIAVREIDSAEAVPALVAGDIDLAFARLQGQLGSSLEIMTLARDRLFVALPAGHRLAGKTRLRMKELADEPFVMFERRLSPVYFDSVVAACRASDFSPRILHDVRSVAAQVAFVGCGQGIALVPSSTRKLAPETVMLRPLVEEVEIVTTAAAWSSTSVNPAVQSAVVVLRSISDGVGSVRGKRASRRLGRG